VPDAISIDKLKKSNPQFTTLKQYFQANYKYAKPTKDMQDLDEVCATSRSAGSGTTEKKRFSMGLKKLTTKNLSGRKRYSAARNNFIQSVAGYSLLCYVLQIKDRHNGNILLDSRGHMIHVDFGFLLSNSPGNVRFESSVFKLTAEYVELMGGQRSKHFNRFKNLIVKGFMALREHAEELISFVEMTMISGIDLPCFKGRERALTGLRERL
jgi:phosphatidylinositol kinase/protein kinase (PI-3  family)